MHLYELSDVWSEFEESVPRHMPEPTDAFLKPRYQLQSDVDCWQGTVQVAGRNGGLAKAKRARQRANKQLGDRVVKRPRNLSSTKRRRGRA